MTNNKSLEAQVREFFDYAGSAAAHEDSGGQIEFGVGGDPTQGFRVVMKVGLKAMTFPPGWGRKFARASREGAQARIDRMDDGMRERIKPDTILAVFDEMDKACKEAMRMQRQTTPANSP